MLDEKVREMIKPCLQTRLTRADEEQIRELAKQGPQYKIGEIVDVSNWDGIYVNRKIIDCKITRHAWNGAWMYGYVVNGDAGFMMGAYIPENQLHKPWAEKLWKEMEKSVC